MLRRKLFRFHQFLQKNFSTYNILISCLYLGYKRKIHPSAALIGYRHIKLGKQLTIQRNSMLSAQRDDAEILIGDACWLADSVCLEAGRKIVIGDRTSLQSRCRLLGDVSIGDNCLLAPNVFVSSGKHTFGREPALPIRVQESIYGSENIPVVIDDDCWLGVNVVVMPGMRIGRGSIVGANSVVTKDIAPYSIIGGVPAKLLKTRLEVCPKESISTDCFEDWPYFYSGFIIPETKSVQSLSQEKGLQVKPIFQLWLKSFEMYSKITLQLFVEAKKTLQKEKVLVTFDKVARAVSLNDMTITCKLDATADGFYQFVVEGLENTSLWLLKANLV